MEMPTSMATPTVANALTGASKAVGNVKVAVLGIVGAFRGQRFLGEYRTLAPPDSRWAVTQNL
jgi:uncharacterized membrane protein YeaQ/YmgE (transglycosylase-associated protein family)